MAAIDFYNMVSGVGDAWKQNRQESDARAATQAYADAIMGGPAALPEPTGLAALGKMIGIPQKEQPKPQNAGGLASLSPEIGKAASAISGIESGGRYDALGPVTKSGDRAIGKYQIMAANIPSWSREALGREVTPQEFAANPQLQDAVFQHKFGQYVQKYGPEGAARAWFAGEGGMNDPNRKDQLGTSVANYGQKFAQAYGPGATGPAPQPAGPGQQAIAQAAPQAPQQPPQSLAALGAQMPGAQPQQMAQAAPAQAQQPQSRFSPEESAALRQMIANPQTRGIGMQIMQSKLQGNKLQYQTGADGEIIALDPTGRQAPQVVYKAAVKPMVVAADSGIYDPATKSFIQSPSSANTPDQKNFEAAKREGYTGSFNDWYTASKKAGATTVSVDTKGDNKFAEAAGTGLAKRFNEVLDDGDAAVNDKALIGQLGELGQVIGTGAPAAIKGWLAERGIVLDGTVGPIQAYNAIVDKLTPAQRIAGAGASSDRDVSIFKNSLPRLINTPEGNQIIRDTLSALADHKIARARIAEQALTRDLTPAEAIKQMRALPNPYDRFKEYQKGGKPQGAAQSPAGGQRPAATGAPVRVQTPDEARKLPKGTPIILPDGRQGVVP